MRQMVARHVVRGVVWAGGGGLHACVRAGSGDGVSLGGRGRGGSRSCALVGAVGGWGLVGVSEWCVGFQARGGGGGVGTAGVGGGVGWCCAAWSFGRPAGSCGWCLCALCGSCGPFLATAPRWVWSGFAGGAAVGTRWAAAGTYDFIRDNVPKLFKHRNLHKHDGMG